MRIHISGPVSSIRASNVEAGEASSNPSPSAAPKRRPAGCGVSASPPCRINGCAPSKQNGLPVTVGDRGRLRAVYFTKLAAPRRQELRKPRGVRCGVSGRRRPEVPLSPPSIACATGSLMKGTDNPTASLPLGYGPSRVEGWGVLCLSRGQDRPAHNRQSGVRCSVAAPVTHTLPNRIKHLVADQGGASSTPAVCTSHQRLGELGRPCLSQTQTINVVRTHPRRHSCRACDNPAREFGTPAGA
jgi:hypothetical protein